MWEWACRSDEAVELVVSELVTNAIQASRAQPRRAGPDEENLGVPSVWLWLASDGAAGRRGRRQQPATPVR